MRAPISRAAAFSARIRSCSPGSGAGHGNTISSWISPMNSDLVNDETARSGLSSICAWVAASIGRSLLSRVIPTHLSASGGILEVMSEREIEIVRSVVAAWDRGDVDEMERWIAADAELRPLRAQLEGTVYRGPEGLRELWDDLNADWEDLKLPVDELREVGDKVLALGRLVARGRASGIDLEVPIGQLWEVRDGRVVGMVAYSDPEDAVRAASA